MIENEILSIFDKKYNLKNLEKMARTLIQVVMKQ